MPKVNPGESENAYVERCIPVILHEGTAKDGEQASAICHSMWRNNRESGMRLSAHKRLLEAIKAREDNTPFNRGIVTADRYVKTLQECVGSDMCYRYASKGTVSFNDVMRKAASTLTYNNEDMVLEEQVSEIKSFSASDIYGSVMELPKNTLMVFKHVVTTPKRDRDGDRLRTEGARPDPNMIGLWQHTHTLPIGKMLGISEHTNKKLSFTSAIVDINELSHDSAVMIDNKMGRFSHGFKALDYEDFEDEGGRGGKSTRTGGFDIKSFEMMEWSLVSVPSNTDAETEEVILSLVSGGKLTSPIMKGYGKTIKEKRPLTVAMGGFGGKIPLSIDLNLSVNGKSVEEEVEDEPAKSVKCAGKPNCSCGCGGKKPAPEEADANNAGAEEVPNDKKVEVDEKAGRVLNSTNLTSLSKARDNLSGIVDRELLMSNDGKAKCRAAHDLINEVISSAEVSGVSSETDLTAKDAMAQFLLKASKTERDSMSEVLKTFDVLEKQNKLTRDYKKISRSS